MTYSEAVPPLSLALRETTAQAHREAESSAFMADLVEGRSCPSAWGALAVQQWVLYRALEDVIAEHYADHPLVEPLHDPALERVPSIESDLRTIFGPDALVRLAHGQLSILPATAAYASALRDGHSAEMVVAHHYVRYLGDLSGGQVIGTMLGRHYGVPAEARSFYRFDGIPKPKPYKDAYRAALDALPASPAQRERILAEAVQAFRLNQALFADLEASRGRIHAAAGVSPDA